MAQLQYVHIGTDSMNDLRVWRRATNLREYCPIDLQRSKHRPPNGVYGMAVSDNET